MTQINGGAENQTLPPAELSAAREAIGAALGRMPSGLFIVTAGEGADAQGMLASWVQQCGFDPPRVSVAVRKGRGLGELLHAGAHFAVHVLAEGQKQVLGHFGKGQPPGPEGFLAVGGILEPGSPPHIPDTLACLECVVTTRFDAGDHEMVVGEVRRGRPPSAADQKPWVHTRRSGFQY